MAKLSLTAAPTFVGTVDVPIAGQADPVPVPMTFRHRTRTDLLEWDSKRAERTDLQSFLDMVVGWDLEDVAFNEENARVFLENYAGAAYAAYLTYLDELSKVRRKN